MASIVDPPPEIKSYRLAQDLRALRTEVESLASTLASVDVPKRPQEITADGQRVWHDSDVARVHVVEDCVFIAGRKDWMTWPDWTALRPGEARKLGVALLAAAGDVNPVAPYDGDDR